MGPRQRLPAWEGGAFQGCRGAEPGQQGAEPGEGSPPQARQPRHQHRESRSCCCCSGLMTNITPIWHFHTFIHAVNMTVKQFKGAENYRITVRAQRRRLLLTFTFLDWSAQCSDATLGANVLTSSLRDLGIVVLLVPFCRPLQNNDEILTVMCLLFIISN